MGGPEISPVPDRAQESFDLGLEAVLQGDWYSAESQLESAVRWAPWWPDARYNLALVHPMGNHFDDAVEQLEIYLTLVPNAPDSADVRRKIEQLNKQPRNPITPYDNLGADDLLEMLPGKEVKPDITQYYDGAPFWAAPDRQGN